MYRPEAEEISLGNTFGLKMKTEKNYKKMLKFRNKNSEKSFWNCFIISLFGFIKIVENEYNDGQGSW